MQAASSPYLPPPPQPYYQALYHIQPLGPQDYELKRQYLALLPPQQIIEICLTFDVHVPPYIKSTIWPPDMNAAIANLRKPTTNGDVSARSQKANDKPLEPIMASLDKPSEGPSDPDKSTSSTESQAIDHSPDKQSENVSTATATATTTTQGQASTPPTPAPAPTAPEPPSIQQQVPYPHQPYGYSQHPTAAYPHAPYYPPPPGYPSYPHSSYPHYPPPVPNGYHLHQPLPHHPGYLPPSNPIYPSPLAPQPATYQDQGSDDLPSYEEMIVEALQESADPEGCAPKDLFGWMAARYPVQSNFRPSASQALQKAFKRGRFEKSNNGKYRLNATWEGGSSSRRTTRRPQMQPHSQSGPSAASPFTHAPLVHHHQQNAPTQPYPGQPFPYPYGGPASGYAQPQQQQAAQAVSSETAKAATSATDKSVQDPDRDAYEAARNILKAINFGDLFQISQQEGSDGKKTDDVSVDQLTALLIQAQNAISQPAETNVLQQVTSTSAIAPLPTLSAAAGVAVAMGNVSGPPAMNVRAELQAQLALLAVQLAELGQENSEGSSSSPVVAQPQASPTQVPPIVAVPQPEKVHQHQPTTEAPPPIFEPPPMDALLPPPEFSTPLRPPPPPSERPSAQHQEQQQRQENSTAIDPVLQNIEAVEAPPVITGTTYPAQSPPVDLPSTVEPPPPTLATTLLRDLPLPPPLPPIFTIPVPESEGHVTTPNFVEGEDDSGDDDMEEII